MHRLRRTTDIQRTFRDGRRFYSPWAVLHTRCRESGEEISPGPRLAIIAGKRFRTAVARNRARRILREPCRSALAGVRKPWDLILVARGEALGSSYRDRTQALNRMLQDAGVIPEETACANE